MVYVLETLQSENIEIKKKVRVDVCASCEKYQHKPIYIFRKKINFEEKSEHICINNNIVCVKKKKIIEL